jgi:hypothetical protein
VVAWGRHAEPHAAVGRQREAIHLADAVGQRDDRAMNREPPPVEAGVGLDAAFRAHVKGVVEPQQPERRGDIVDRLDRRGAGFRNEVDPITALIAVRGGGDPESALGVERERCRGAEALRVNRRGQASRAPQPGADGDEAISGGGRRRRRRGRRDARADSRAAGRDRNDDDECEQAVQDDLNDGLRDVRPNARRRSLYERLRAQPAQPGSPVKWTTPSIRGFLTAPARFTGV